MRVSGIGPNSDGACRPAKRLKAWHRKCRRATGPNAPSLKEFARTLLTPVNGVVSNEANIVTRWRFNKKGVRLLQTPRSRK